MKTSSKNETRVVSHLNLVILLVFVFIFMVCNVVVVVAVEEDDIRCLKEVKASLEDPQGMLDSWVFNTSSLRGGYICVFLGVGCWNPIQNRLLSLQLPSSKLSGKVPDSLQYCVSLLILDLSSNNISGTIPSQICTWLPYLVHLDLSGNQFSGSIPPELAECTYLNKLILSNNRLSGRVPSELSRLARLRDFDVANNHLSGPISPSMSNFSAARFERNDGLCGKPLAACDYGV